VVVSKIACFETRHEAAVFSCRLCFPSISLILLMNSFNKTEAAVFSCRLFFLGGGGGLSLSSVYA